MPGVRPAYSFVVDEGARFAYQAWHLAHSLVRFCRAEPRDIHIQCTQNADALARSEFERAGFSTHSLNRFGDGKYCNKIGQIENIVSAHHNDIFVLLDTDTIAVSDLSRWLSRDSVVAKTVDSANPPIADLDRIATAAGLKITDVQCRTDSDDGNTYAGNCNGGMYSIPASCAHVISKEWRHWALWLLENIEPLRRTGREAHVDQVSFWLALLSSGTPFSRAKSNANYFIHMDAPHLYFDPTHAISLLHYHNQALDVVGLIEPRVPICPAAQEAVRVANGQIGKHFHNTLFWNYRYQHFPERGSGIGSRGDNCDYKRALLRAHGIEAAQSVLDVGCGDAEVVRALSLNQYLGLDLSSVALERARQVMPSGTFQLGMDKETTAADFVLCLEVLIHQPNLLEYQTLIDFSVQRTIRTLVVSGYSAPSEAITSNSMVHFHEPLKESLVRTGRFSSVRQVGAHTDVAIYRCDV